jgi:diadenosine tetraphosphate (Ap4A) HIT family hydrolase
VPDVTGTGPAEAAGCIFCDGAPRNRRLAQSKHFLVIADAFPLTGGHSLLVPRRHVVSLFELTLDEAVDAFGLLCRVGQTLDDRYDPDGYNIGVNEGRAAGRTVDHLHIHVIPRTDGDVPDPRGGVRNILPGPSPDLWSPR